MSPTNQVFFYLFGHLGLIKGRQRIAFPLRSPRRSRVDSPSLPDTRTGLSANSSAAVIRSSICSSERPSSCTSQNSIEYIIRAAAFSSTKSIKYASPRRPRSTASASRDGTRCPAGAAELYRPTQRVTSRRSLTTENQRCRRRANAAGITPNRPPARLFRSRSRRHSRSSPRNSARRSCA